MDIATATTHLRKADPKLGAIIDQVPPLLVHKSVNYFESLVESIVSQQLSIKAADTIFKRFLALFTVQNFPPPELILAMPDDKMRGVGISYQKISYIKDLAQRVDEKLLDLEKIDAFADEEVIVQLTQVKGIGKWTAEMFLMFSLNRPDVFSYGDLGLKNAMKKIYNLRSHPSEKRAKQISNKWKPYRTIACRYLWKSLELK